MAFAAALLTLGAISAQAMPVAAVKQAVETSDVIPVAGGCGRGWFRDAYGVCRPARRYRGAVVVAPAPYIVAPPAMIVAPGYRGCPRGMFRNRYGRCVWY